jgi:hypothetical protein
MNKTNYSRKRRHEGKITLGYGNHQIEIASDRKVREVFLCPISDGVSCCAGSLDFVSFAVSETGFTIFAEVKSNSCIVKWQVG